jgi:redox-sensitive bicupin YhaK (pirin superfamily)
MSSSTTSSIQKTIKEICRKPRPHWVGDGFYVYPVFANKAFTNQLSPFLMFDYAEPKSFPPNPNKRRGVGQHPHRGFETVTLAFQGEVEHSDSVGNNGVIGPGEVQWMTAARGIVHEEFHSTEFSKRGGVFEFCQVS